MQLLKTYPAIAEAAGLLGCRVLADTKAVPPRRFATPTDFHLGYPGDEAAGIPGIQHTPVFRSLEDLEAWLAPHIPAVKALAEQVRRTEAPMSLRAFLVAFQGHETRPCPLLQG